MAGALDGLVVLEWAEGVAAPFCGKLLSDFGATVVKLEAPGRGDPSRSWGPFRDARPDPNASGLFLHLNTGKRSVALDPCTPDGREQFLRLFRRCDVLLEDRTLQQKSAAGLDLETLRSENPRAVVTSLTPFGQDGPYRNYLAGELVLYHLSGYAQGTPTEVEDPEHHPPLSSGGLDTGVLGGASAAVATLVALFDRDCCGRGACIDVSTFDVLVYTTRWPLSFYTYEHWAANRLAGSHISTGPTGYLLCKDGYVNVHCGNDEHWRRFKQVMGNPDWAETELMATRASRTVHWPVLRPKVEEWTANYTRDELYRMFQSNGACCFPLLNVKEVQQSDVLAIRGYFQTVRHPVAGDVVHPGPPFQLPEAPVRLQPAPVLGEHTDELLSELDSPPPPRLPSPHWGEGSGKGVRVPVKGGGSGPLSGIRILDLTRIIAGPAGTQLLGQMGADVLKVESRRHPDMSRTGSPFADRVPGLESSGYNHGLNAAKRSITIDLTIPAGQRLLDRLVPKCDVVMENFAWPAAKRFGMSYDRFARLNPSVVYLSMAGLGRTEPYGNYVTFGPQLMALAGWDSLTGYPGEHPAEGGLQFTDSSTGLYTALAIMMALHHRLRTGKGQYIDLAMLEGLVGDVANGLLEYNLTGRLPGSNGNSAPWAAPYGAYRCLGDDRWVAIAVRDDAEWARLCEAMGHPEWLRDPRYATARERIRRRAEVDAMVTSWTRERTPNEAMGTLQAAGVPAGRSSTFEDVVEDPHVRARGTLIARPHPVVGARDLPDVPFRIDGVRAFNDARAPLLGEHTDEILAEVLALTPAEISALRMEGALE